MTPAERQTAEGILFTDQYQLTMAQLYFRMGYHERPSQFDHFFRSYPDYGGHKAGYCVNAGLDWFLNWLETARFGDEEIAHLRQQTGRSGQPIFQEDFLHWLRHNDHFASLNIRAIPEGRVVHPNVPLTVVQGPLAAAQLIETSLLNHLNYQTLIATKAARIYESGRGQLMMEFGLRRGHDRGANAGARAALIGGAHFTSNVGISHVLGFQPKGTHAHSMVQAFMTLGQGELEAFQAYADLYPDDCLLLVDTIDTLHSGVPNAIKVFERLRQKGHEPVGIRLDSGDLAYLSIQAARELDKAGFADTSIVLSNNLDELVIWQILTQIQEEAALYGVDAEQLIKRLVFGVGTRLITSHGKSALGGVYKLVGLQDNGRWRPAIKISETPAKTPNPGQKEAWRLYDGRGAATADLLSLTDEEPATMPAITLRHPMDHSQMRTLPSAAVSQIEPLLTDVMVAGKVVMERPSIEQLRQRRLDDVARLDPGVRRLVNPHIYHVSLTQKLWELKEELIEQSRRGET
jgi:nicotinate phosphoribosyltransferase